MTSTQTLYIFSQVQWQDFVFENPDCSSIDIIWNGIAARPGIAVTFWSISLPMAWTIIAARSQQHIVQPPWHSHCLRLLYFLFRPPSIEWSPRSYGRPISIFFRRLWNASHSGNLANDTKACDHSKEEAVPSRQIFSLALDFITSRVFFPDSPQPVPGPRERTDPLRWQKWIIKERI